MLSSRTMSCSANAASPMAADRDEILVKHGLQFADSLKDLKNLRKQLYSAADYFESSYNRDSRKQFVVDSSKDYVAKALVNTVDHLGSVADKLNKFLDQKVNECSATNTQFSCIEQRLCTIQRLVQSRGLARHLYETEDTGNHKHSILPSAETSTLALGKSNVSYGNRISSLPVPEPDDVKQDSSFLKSFEAARMKQTLMRKEDSRREASPNPLSFSFTNKEAVGRRSVSPLGLPFNLSISRRSVSPSPSLNRGQQAWEGPRRAMSACRRREMSNSNREMEMESYTKKSKHLLKALLSLHQSTKAILHKQ